MKAVGKLCDFYRLEWKAMAHLHLNELSLICDMWLNKITYLLTYNGNLAHFTVFASMQRARVMYENRLISRVNLPLFTLIVRQGKVYETLIMRSWTWVKKKRKKFVT